MFKQVNTNHIGWAILLVIAVLLLEVTIFNSGIIFSVLLSGACIYLGRQKLHSTFWKVLFWFGCISLGITILTSITFKVLLIAIILYGVIEYAKAKKEPKTIQPEIAKTVEHVTETEPIIKQQPLLSNLIFGNQQTSENSYEWTDISVQTGVGDTVIDLSNTVLPNGESVICIRNVVGNVIILVPYELELGVRHSVMFGKTTILNHQQDKTFNQTLSYQTEGYYEADQKVKIITSMIVGDIEVKRV